VRNISEDLRRLVRNAMPLAQTEITEKLKHAGVVVAIAGVAALVGKKQLRQAAPPVPERAVASVKTDVAEIKESIKQ
jgi:molybdenum cofactor biosynthesis enzyme